MTRLYLIRHAEAEGNLYRIAHGHYNGLITNYRGYQQIDALRERFREVDIDAVYSSDLYRTQTTARAIWLPKSLPLRLEPAFREICMGQWEDHTWHELNVKYPEDMYKFNRRADLWRIPGAETAQQVVDRFIPALERVAKAHEGGTVAVFSHGMALRTVLGVLQGQTLAEVGQMPHGDNTAVSLLEWENGAFRVVYRDDNSHLAERGLSTFAKQSWWKDKNMAESGEGYAMLTDGERETLGVPAGGRRRGCTVRRRAYRRVYSAGRGGRAAARVVRSCPGVAGQRAGYPAHGTSHRRLPEAGTRRAAAGLPRQDAAPLLCAAGLRAHGGGHHGEGRAAGDAAPAACLSGVMSPAGFARLCCH